MKDITKAQHNYEFIKNYFVEETKELRYSFNKYDKHSDLTKQLYRELHIWHYHYFKNSYKGCNCERSIPKIIKKIDIYKRSQNIETEEEQEQ